MYKVNLTVYMRCDVECSRAVDHASLNTCASERFDERAAIQLTVISSENAPVRQGSDDNKYSIKRQYQHYGALMETSGTLYELFQITASG